MMTPYTLTAKDIADLEEHAAQQAALSLKALVNIEGSTDFVESVKEMAAGNGSGSKIAKRALEIYNENL